MLTPDSAAATASTNIARMQDAMREASRIVLAGFELGTDAQVWRYPDRFMDERGKAMWDRIMVLISEKLTESENAAA